MRQLLALSLLSLALPVLPVQGQEEPVEPPSLRIFLPTEIKISNALLRLGDIAVVRGDEDLVRTASALSLGRLFVPSQHVILTRPTILSRLATKGITGRQITISGANKVIVRRDHKAISGQELTELARTFLEEKMGLTGERADAVRMQAVRVPQYIYVDPSLEDVSLEPSLNPSTNPGYARVAIVATAKGEPLANRDVSFRLEYKTSRLVAKESLKRGSVLTPDNTVIETVYAPQPQPDDWEPPYGMVIKRPLAANMEVTTNLVADPVPAKPPVTVEVGKLVIIKIERPGFRVTVNGVTEEAGSTGDVIEVKNIDSQLTVHCRIKEDGTVEPIL